MYLQLAHTRLEVFQISKLLVLECYRLTKDFPPEEKFNLVSQIRRAALSVHLNLAEGSTRKSPVERKRYFIVSRGSLIEVDTAFDIAENLLLCQPEQTQQMGTLLVQCFSQLSALIKNLENQESMK
jgi:four helix bundle protein